MTDSDCCGQDYLSKPDAIQGRCARRLNLGVRRRITAELRAQSVIGRHRVRRLMRKQGLQAIQPRRFVPRTTDSRHGQQMGPNLLLERAIKVDRPRQVIVGDITYLPLQGGGWAYLATWMDLFSRKIVGWQVDGSMMAE